MRLSLYFYLLLCSSTLGHSQVLGCTDPQATNYNPLAEKNDGSCIYPTTILQPSLVCRLPASMAETSGLIYDQEGLISANDGGNPSNLDIFDATTCRLLNSENLNIPNEDWEDLSFFEGSIYIGDFGNNQGNRRDLAIYRYDTLTKVIEKISFSYSDQSIFSWTNGESPYDCEAMLVNEDGIHLFTKDRINYSTTHYLVPDKRGTHTAIPADTLDVEGLITAADLSKNKTIALTGYQRDGTIFSYLLFDYPEGRFFEGHKRKIALGTSFTLGQIEAFTFTQGDQFFLTNESNFGIQNSLWNADFTPYTGHLTSQQSPEVENWLDIYKTHDGLIWKHQQEEVLSIGVFSLNGQLVLPIVESNHSEGYIPTESLSSGVHIALFQTPTRTMVYKWFED